MLNKVILQGRLTRAPELRYTQNNTPVASASLAVERSRAAKGQERETDFFDLVAWRYNAEFLSKWFDKGQQVLISGMLQSRRWQDKQGNNRTSIEVVVEEVNFCGSKQDTSKSGQSRGVPNVDGEDYSEIEDDGEVPF
jgi:single-strand DNA-binding protein